MADRPNKQIEKRQAAIHSCYSRLPSPLHVQSTMIASSSEILKCRVNDRHYCEAKVEDEPSQSLTLLTNTPRH